MDDIRAIPDRFTRLVKPYTGLHSANFPSTTTSPPRPLSRTDWTRRTQERWLRRLRSTCIPQNFFKKIEDFCEDFFCKLSIKKLSKIGRNVLIFDLGGGTFDVSLPPFCLKQNIGTKNQKFRKFFESFESIIFSTCILQKNPSDFCN